MHETEKMTIGDQNSEEQDLLAFLEGLVESAGEASGEVSEKTNKSEPEKNAPEENTELKNAEFKDIEEAYYAALRKEALRLNNDPEFQENDADIRFSTALNLRAVRQAICCIIGAGGLGNWQWRILMSMGFKQIIIYDDDVVGIENVGPQAHSVFDIGLPKVEAVRRAALRYRGIGIVARNKRVMTLEDIENDLGYVPSVIIGCTDSADFRNGFIQSLWETLSGWNIPTPQIMKKLPELFIDYRMALGDWNAYIVPARAMISHENTRSQINSFFRKYKSNACFTAEEAVQEACTERAISYTGASVASFTGALLHWWFSEGRTELREDADKLFYGFLMSNPLKDVERTKFTWKMSYSSRDWESITPTKREMFLEKKLHEEKRNVQEAEETIQELLAAITKNDAITRNDADNTDSEADDVPADLVAVPMRVASQDLVVGDRINLGVPGEDYEVLATGRRLKLRDVSSNEEFLCRHFQQPVIRYTDEEHSQAEHSHVEHTSSEHMPEEHTSEEHFSGEQCIEEQPVRAEA